MTGHWLIVSQRHAEVADNLSVKRVRTWERGLLQTMTNLIDNALKYSRDARPPRIHVSSEQVPGAVRITVSDNGIGFDPSQAHRGNGLKNLRRRAADLRGDLQIHSQPGSGSRFTITAPIT